jgi:hypothetical protein
MRSWSRSETGKSSTGNLGASDEKEIVRHRFIAIWNFQSRSFLRCEIFKRPWWSRLKIIKQGLIENFLAGFGWKKLSCCAKPGRLREQEFLNHSMDANQSLPWRANTDAPHDSKTLWIFSTFRMPPRAHARRMLMHSSQASLYPEGQRLSPSRIYTLWSNINSSTILYKRSLNNISGTRGDL